MIKKELASYHRVPENYGPKTDFVYTLGIVNEKSMSKRLEESGYLRKVMLFNATPKVNLSG